MTAEELSKELKESMAKVDGILNIIRSSPVILAYNKLLGLQQKFGSIVSSLEGLGPEQEITNESPEE